MNDKSGSFFLSIVSVLCLAVISVSVYLFLEDKEIIDSFQSIKEYTFENVGELSDLPPSSEQPQAQETVSESDVTEKIVESFISPYGANTAYNNVYVKNKTGKALDIESFLSRKSNVDFEKNAEPQALIVHTHTSECYLAEPRDYYTESDVSRTEDTSYNVVAVGRRIAEKLNAAGFNTLHATTVHDKTYTGSYSRSAETIQKYLKDYPSVKLVIDVHRDSISGEDGTRIKPITTIEGRKSAQVMLVMCCGEGISGFDNWQENLSFAIKYQQTMEVMYPSLARAMHYLSYKYNQNLSTPSILLEVGTEANSIDEALTGADFAANALVAYLNTLT